MGRERGVAAVRGEVVLGGGVWGVGAPADGTNRSAVMRLLRARCSQAARTAGGDAMRCAHRAASAAGRAEQGRLV